MVAANNAFDRKIDAQKGALDSSMRDAAIYVHDTMDLAFAAAQSFFGDKPPVEAVMAMYDRISERHGYLRSKLATEAADDLG